MMISMARANKANGHNKSTAEPMSGEPRSVISQYMAEIGRKGGKRGGKRRLETMSPEERRKAASAAAKARWKKRRQG